MNCKRTAVGFLAAMMICCFANSMEAAGFSASQSWGPIEIDEKIGESADALRIKIPTTIAFEMLDDCVATFVRTHFQKQGIQLTDEEAKAVAFGVLQMTDLDESDSGNSITFTVDYIAEQEYMLDLVYRNKKYLRAFMENYAEYAQLAREKAVAARSYVQYGAEANTMLRYNQKLQALLIKFNFMRKYWTAGYELIVTGEDVNFRAEPSTDSAILDVLDKEETLSPAGEKIEANGRSWYPAYNARGDFGYVCADYIRSAD